MSGPQDRGGRASDSRQLRIVCTPLREVNRPESASVAVSISRSAFGLVCLEQAEPHRLIYFYFHTSEGFNTRATHASVLILHESLSN